MIDLSSVPVLEKIVAWLYRIWKWIRGTSKPTNNAGEGGNAQARRGGSAMGGRGGDGGGQGGGSGGRGGDATAEDPGSVAIGGEGGGGGRADGIGGRGGRSPFEVMGIADTVLPDGRRLYDVGRGGDGGSVADPGQEAGGRRFES